MYDSFSIVDVVKTIFGPEDDQVSAHVKSAGEETLDYFEEAIRWYYQNQQATFQEPNARISVQVTWPHLIFGPSVPNFSPGASKDESILNNLLVYLPRVLLIDSNQGSFLPGEFRRDSIDCFIFNLMRFASLLRSQALVIRGPCNILIEDLQQIAECAQEILQTSSSVSQIAEAITTCQDKQPRGALEIMMISYVAFGLVKPPNESGLWRQPEFQVIHVLWQFLTSARMNCAWACESIQSAAVARAILTAIERASPGRFRSLKLHSSQFEFPDCGSLLPHEIEKLRATRPFQNWYHALISMATGLSNIDTEQLSALGAEVKDSLKDHKRKWIKLTIDWSEQQADFMSDSEVLHLARSIGAIQRLNFLNTFFEDPARIASYPRRRVWVALH